MRLPSLLVCALLILPATLAAQASAVGIAEWGRPPLPSDSMPRTIAEAERLGARMPRPTATNPVDSAAQAMARGTSERKCVDVTALSIAQSGDFVVGPFDRYSAVWHTGYGKLWWQPRHISTNETLPLVVRASRLEPAGSDRVFGQSSLARGGSPTGGIISQTRFYPTGIHFPTTGTWLMVATAGDNWGCFVFSFE
jgi:hypothetical protein